MRRGRQPTMANPDEGHIPSHLETLSAFSDVLAKHQTDMRRVRVETLTAIGRVREELRAMAHTLAQQNHETLALVRELHTKYAHDKQARFRPPYPDSPYAPTND